MKKLLVTVVVAFMMCFSTTAFAIPASGTVWFDFDGDVMPDTELSLLPGGIFDVDIYISSLDPVYTMGFDFTYDPTQTGVITKSANAALWPYQPDAQETVPGTITFMGGAPLGGGDLGSQSTVSGDNILLASLEMECLGVGISYFVTGMSSVSGAGFWNGVGVDIADTFTWGEARVNQQVPIPGALILLGSGLLGLVSVRQRKNSV
ncbi:MAG: hypothetical protein JXR80_03330 [Deltaproteobacteria bacterium]|nr:hypothetical protein [Deltaproteobacteria bacterium]